MILLGCEGRTDCDLSSSHESLLEDEWSKGWSLSNTSGGG